VTKAKDKSILPLFLKKDVLAFLGASSSAGVRGRETA